MTAERLAELQRLCDSASGGPWKPEYIDDVVSAPDAAFIAAARTALPEALAEIARLRTLGKEATNGWACYARTKLESAEIARLHKELDA